MSDCAGCTGCSGPLGTAGGTGCGGACGCDGDWGAGCCRGVEASTPQPVRNRPGLSRLSYRVGTHPQFLASLQSGLSRADRPALARLRTRDPADLSLALLDGWATLADVLTFYTERIAQEGYLRTATERRSLVDLAALVGYRPRPGLGATAYLAYTVAPDATVVIPPGSRAQSVPDPGQLPATYETADPVVARAGTNTLPVRRIRTALLTAGTVGSRNRLAVDGPHPEIRRGEALRVRFGGPAGVWTLLEVTDAEVVGERTLFGVRELHAAGTGSAPIVVHDAAPRRARRREENPVGDTTRLGELVRALRRPPSVPPPSERELGRDLSRLLAGGSDGVARLIGIAVPEVAAVLGPALAGSAAPDPVRVDVEHLAVRGHLFGHQAPLLPRYQAGRVKGFVDPLVSDLPIDDVPVPISIAAAPPPTIDPPTYHPDRTLLLDAVQDTVLPGSEVLLVNPALEPPVSVRTVEQVAEVSVSALGISGRVTQLLLDTAWPDVPDGNGNGDGDQDLRTVLRGTTVLAHPAPLAPSVESIDDEDVDGEVLELDGLHRDLEPGRWVVVSGERTDREIRDVQRPLVAKNQPDPEDPGTGVRSAELSMIASVEHRTVLVEAEDGESDPEPLPGDPLHTFVRLAEPLAYAYRRSTVRLYGNVVRATHGESKEEVLGSGDATRPWASYPLKQPPLTHLPAPTAEGAASTLEVFVDGIRWREVPDFVGAGPADRCYVVRHDEKGTVRVVFGDGVRGARPPTGSENITARYRSGQGRTGNVPDGRITIATSRPLGVMEVTNPVPATGGADAEGADAVRRNAVLGVAALDRLVSVSDYADLAGAFAGIGSAAADEITDGRRRVVHVTVAGIDDAPIAPTSDLLRTLRQVLLELGDPHVDVRVAVRRLRLAVVAAGVRIDADRRWADVEPAVRAAVLARFGPSAQRVGRPLAASAVLAAMAAVPGVDFVDLDVFDSLDAEDLVGDDPASGLGLLSHLGARRAETDAGEPGGIRAAELVLVSPDAHDTLVLTELT